MENTIFQRLSDYAASDAVAMHMPGHKRNVPGIAFLEELGAKYDITEIEGFDDLHHPRGILRDAMERAARLWKSDATYFLVNGSTCGILAAVRACALLYPNGKLIMARNCHKSVYNAAELCCLRPLFIQPPQVEDFGFCGSISPSAVELLVRENPGTPVIITSPTYEGVISNIAEIAVICHLYGCPLIVDEAHGAHLGLLGCFPSGAVAAGADVVIQSIHKTLTGLTQTGVIHINGGLVPREAISRQLAVFETTSPSYLLMASIDGTVELIESSGAKLFSDWQKRLDRFDSMVSPLQKLTIPGHTLLFDCQSEQRPGYVRRGVGSGSVYGYDRSKIIISCEGTDKTGVWLMSSLRESFNIECEMAAGGYTVAMTGILDSQEGMERLAKALLTLEGEIKRTPPRIPMAMPKLPPRRMSVCDALAENTKPISLWDAAGKISGEYVWAYPPGIPLVIPGEELTEELLKSLILQREAGVSLRSTGGGMPRYISTVL